MSGDPQELFIHGGEVSDCRYLGGMEKIETVGGAGVEYEIAEMATIGEAVERYAATFPSDHILAPASKMDQESIVRNWPGYTNKQINFNLHFKEFCDDTPISWTSAFDLHTGNKKMVPAAIVYLPWEIQEGETRIFPSLSSGLASAQSAEEAILKGVLELIERDAFTLAWLSGQPLPVVDPQWTKSLVKQIDPSIPISWRFSIVDLSNHTHVPVYASVVTAPSKVGDVVAVGAAASLDPVHAARKAVIEAIQTVPYVRHLIEMEPDWMPDPVFSNLVSFKDHSRVYTLRPDIKHALINFHPENDEIVIKAKNPDLKIRHSAKSLYINLEKLEIGIYVKRLTTVDLYPFGLEVMKVMSPHLMPLHGHYQLAHLTCERMWKLPQIFPFMDPNKTPKTEEDIYPWPHPFA